MNIDVVDRVVQQVPIARARVEEHQVGTAAIMIPSPSARQCSFLELAHYFLTGGS